MWDRLKIALFEGGLRGYFVYLSFFFFFFTKTHLQDRRNKSTGVEAKKSASWSGMVILRSDEDLSLTSSSSPIVQSHV